MPTYTVTDPQSGKKIKLTGDSPPSEKELNDIFSKVSQPSTMSTLAQAGMAGMNQALAPGVNPTQDNLQMGAQLGQGVHAALGKLAERSADFGAAGGAVGVPAMVAQNFVPTTPTDVALLGAGGEIADPLLGMAGKGINRAGKAILPKLSEALTSIEGPLVDRAIARTAQVGSKLKSILQTDLKFITDSAVDSLNTAVKNKREQLGMTIRRIGDAIGARTDLRIAHPRDIADNLKLELSNGGYKIPGFQNKDATRALPTSVKNVLDEFEMIEGKVAPTTSKIVDAKGNSIVNPGSPGNLKDVSFKRGHNIRKAIDDAVQWGDQHPLFVGKDVDAMLKGARKQLNERLYAASPEFRDANIEFKKMAKVYEFLQKRVLNGQQDQVTNRVARLLKKGSAERAVVNKLDAMGDEVLSKFHGLLDTITAGKYAPNLNPSMGRAVMNTGGGLATFGTRLMHGSPEAMAGAVAVTGALTAAGSPRLNFKVIQASKVIAKTLERLGLDSSSKIAASLSAKGIHDALVDHTLDKVISKTNNAPPTP